ncbi:MAG: hypothetical protein IKJ91_04745 [Clostridia bacterium]|nr:hypothetical protein [Clostridia bacterium]
MKLFESNVHYEPLRPCRQMGTKERYEFTHGTNSVCVYDIETLEFVKEIPVGERPDCHATSLDNKFLYIACQDGLYCIDQDKLEVVKIFELPHCYATNILPNGDLLVHDQAGGVVIIKDTMDMEKIHVYKHVQVIPNGKYRCEIGGKGNFIGEGRYYLCAGWRECRIYLFDTENDEFSFIDFIDYDDVLSGGDDLVITSDKKKAYVACHKGWEERSHVAVIDIENRKIAKLIPTGVGTCGMTMTADERYAICSNDSDDSISVIDTLTDEVVNTPCARRGFEALGITGYIQGITAAQDDSIFVYGCKGNGAIVKFMDIINSNKYIISYEGGMYISEEDKVIKPDI